MCTYYVYYIHKYNFFILQKVLTSDFNGKKEIQSCDDFVNEFKLYLNNSVLLLGQRAYQKSNNLLLIWSRICSTTVFYTYIFGVFDKKLLKQFTDLLEKVCFIFLFLNLNYIKQTIRFY